MNKSIKKNYIYNVIYQLLIIIIPIITTPYISRVLNPEGVGQYSFTSSLITYFTLFASLGFLYYAQREIAKYQGNKKEQSIIFWEIIICRLLSVFIAVFINLLFVVIGLYGDYSILMLVLTINIISVAFDISFYFQGNEEFGKLVINNILIRVISVVAIFVFVKDSNDVWVYVFINSIATILGTSIMWTNLKNRLEKISLKTLKPFKHLKPTIRLFLPTIATSIYVILDKTLIGVITGADAQTGFYEQSEKIVKMLLTVITCLGTVMIPRNSYEIQQGNIDKVKINIYKTFHFVWLMGLPIMCGISVIASNLVPWFFGPGYETCILFIEVLSIIILMIGMNNILGLQYLIPMGKDKQFTMSVVTGAIMNFALNIVLIYFYGAFGAVIATIVAEALVTVVMFIFVRKELSLREIFKTIVKPMIATIVMVGAIIPLALKLESSIINTLIIVGVGMIVYGIMLLILKDSFIVLGINFIKAKLFKKKELCSNIPETEVKEVLDNVSETESKEVVDNIDDLAQGEEVVNNEDDLESDMENNLTEEIK